MVPLHHTLKNGERVEIVAAKQGGPSRDWLYPEQGYAHSHRARAKIRQWFKAQQHEETLAQGRAIIERELARAGATAVSHDAVAVKAGFARADELYAAVGRAELNTRQIVTRNPRRAAAGCRARVRGAGGRRRPAKQARGIGRGILVVGVDRLMTNLARLLQAGAARRHRRVRHRGKGVTIHRQRCSNVARMRAREPERLIVADWGKPRDEVFPVDVVLEAMDRQGLLRDITEIFSRERINVTAANTLTRNSATRMAFTLEVKSLDALSRALALVKDVKGVLSAGRR
jgi:GTP pyrophosphokinase